MVIERAVIVVAFIGSAALAAGCGGALLPGSAESNDVIPGNAIVLHRADLGDQPSSLVDVLDRRFPWMVVHSHSPCPAFELRRENTAPGASEPLVYVDGARAIDTCILASINALDVERVEIYPSGFTSRSGYATNSGGLILVFMRNGR